MCKLMCGFYNFFIFPGAPGNRRIKPDVPAWFGVGAAPVWGVWGMCSLKPR